MTPLSWYEELLLKLLIRSPRIDRIVIYQETHHPTPEDDEPELDYIPFLEELYHAPSAEQ